MSDRASFVRGVRDAIPILLPVLFFGVGFGVLALEAGLGPWLTVFTSIVVLSGAAQFTIVGLIAAGPVPTLVAVTGLALRHVPMSAALARSVAGESLRTRLRLAWVLVDETFGLALRAEHDPSIDVASYKSGADVVLLVTWIGGTIAGVLLGPVVDPDALGIGVLFPLLFLALAVPLVRRRRDWIVAGLAVAATLVTTSVLPVAWQVTVAAVGAAVVGVFVRE